MAQCEARSGGGLSFRAVRLKAIAERLASRLRTFSKSENHFAPVFVDLPGKLSQEKKITYSVGQLSYPVRLVEVSADTLIDYLMAARDNFSFLPRLFRQARFAGTVPCHPVSRSRALPQGYRQDRRPARIMLLPLRKSHVAGALSPITAEVNTSGRMPPVLRLIFWERETKS